MMITFSSMRSTLPTRAIVTRLESRHDRVRGGGLPLAPTASLFAISLLRSEQPIDKRVVETGQKENDCRGGLQPGGETARLMRNGCPHSEAVAK